MVEQVLTDLPLLQDIWSTNQAHLLIPHLPFHNHHNFADPNEESDAQTAFLRSMTGRSTTPTRSRSSTTTVYENQREPEKSQSAIPHPTVTPQFRTQQQQPQQAREPLGEELRQRRRQDGVSRQNVNSKKRITVFAVAVPL